MAAWHNFKMRNLINDRSVIKFRSNLRCKTVTAARWWSRFTADGTIDGGLLEMS